MKRTPGPVNNRLLDALAAGDRRLLADGLQAYRLESGDVLFEPGQDVIQVYFPGPGTIAALMLNLSDGAAAEAAMIGQEGAIGGVISDGGKPAFARGVVQVAGAAMRLPVEVLDSAKRRSPRLRDHFARYADCLLAQVLQSVACNAVHEFDARLARWLLTTQDRIGGRELRLTQEFIAEMLGVRRTYVTRVLGRLAQSGGIERSRGMITITDRRKLERQACECYGYLRRHYERILPGVYPPVPAESDVR
jgi:CRP-like cAMP-binding protein